MVTSIVLSLFSEKQNKRTELELNLIVAKFHFEMNYQFEQQQMVYDLD
jgi:hypothetical protein